MDNDSNPDQLLKNRGARNTSTDPVAEGAQTLKPVNSITRRRLLRRGAGTGLAAVIASSAGSAPTFGGSETPQAAATSGRPGVARFPAARTLSF